MAFFSNPREAITTIACPKCQKFLFIKRTCHEAHMQCSGCKTVFTLQGFIPQMDEAMEKFLEGLYANRI